MTMTPEEWVFQLLEYHLGETLTPDGEGVVVVDRQRTVVRFNGDRCSLAGTHIVLQATCVSVVGLSVSVAVGQTLADLGYPLLTDGCDMILPDGKVVRGRGLDIEITDYHRPVVRDGGRLGVMTKYSWGEPQFLPFYKWSSRSKLTGGLS